MSTTDNDDPSENDSHINWVEAMGWMHAECCMALDRGEDPWQMEVHEMLARAYREDDYTDDVAYAALAAESAAKELG